MGIPAIITAVLGLYLPETKDAQMVNSPEASENVGVTTDSNGNHIEENGYSNGMYLPYLTTFCPPKCSEFWQFPFLLLSKV